MKFVCERCHTRYSIADDKVRQKILKIRCKTCENVITVRDPSPSADEGPPASTALPPAPPPLRGSTPAPVVREWFVAVNGDQVGPVTRSDAARRIVDAKADDEIYIWKEGLDGWKSPEEVPAVRQEVEALRARIAPPPPKKPPPPPGKAGRTSVPGAARVGGGAPQAAAARSSLPVAAPLAEANPIFGEDEHTQIQPFDAALLAPDLMKRPTAGGPAAKSGRTTNGASAAVPASNVDGLLSDVPVSAPGHGLPAGAFVPASQALPGTTRADSALSQITGLSAFMSRNPAFKFIAGGAVVVVLIAIVVIVGLPAEQKPGPPPAPPTTSKTEEPPPAPKTPDEPAPARKEPERRPAVTQATIGPSRSARTRPKPRGGTNQTAITPPPAGGLEPGPVAEAPGVGAARGAASTERAVPSYNPNRTPAAGTESGDGPTSAAIHGVVNRKENQTAIKACYERALKRDDRIRSGRIEVNAAIGTSGIVKNVQLRSPAEFANVEPCIKQAVKRWVFPGNSKEYETEFTLIMQGSQ